MNPAQPGFVAQASRSEAGPAGERRTGTQGGRPVPRSRLPLAILLLVAGVAAFIVGAALAWGDDPLLGFSIGGAGTVALVVGSVLARNAMVGRFLEGGDE